jgi:hypothetical protein
MQHGTATGWRHHKCRCAACHRALLDESKLRAALRRIDAGADPATRVPAAPLRRHLAKLTAAGMTRAQVAELAGVHRVTIDRVARPATRHVTRITAAGLRAVTPP